MLSENKLSKLLVIALVTVNVEHVVNAVIASGAFTTDHIVNVLWAITGAAAWRHGDYDGD